MVDFTPYLTFMNTHHANINMALDIFMVILLIVLIFGGSVVGVGGGFTVAGLVILQLVKITLNLTLKYQDKLMGESESESPMLVQTEF
jgi:L-cystine uptake protein TcyP (sodium:dicarboxylate symporter family)